MPGSGTGDKLTNGGPWSFFEELQSSESLPGGHILIYLMYHENAQTLVLELQL